MEKTVGVIFNGPPGSGKDEMANHVGDNVASSIHMMFKYHLYRLTAALFDVDEDQFIAWATDRVLKEQPMDELRGYSPRGALIFTSEKVVKLAMGRDYFGKVIADRIRSEVASAKAIAAAYPSMQVGKHPIAFLFSDGGFVEELVPLLDVLGTNLYVVRLSREGTTFDGDSRSYLYYEDFDGRIPKENFIDIDNNGTIDETGEKILKALPVTQEA